MLDGDLDRDCRGRGGQYRLGVCRVTKSGLTLQQTVGPAPDARSDELAALVPKGRSDPARTAGTSDHRGRIHTTRPGGDVDRWYRQAWSALELGDAVTFRRAVDEYRQIAQQLRRPYELALSSNMIAAVAQIEGRYDDAEAAGQEALAHAASIDDGNFSWVYFANSGLRSVDRVLVATTYELMKATRADFAGMATFEAALCAVAAVAGDAATADQLLDEQVGPNGATIYRVWSYLSAERLPVLGMLAWVCATTRNVQRRCGNGSSDSPSSGCVRCGSLLSARGSGRSTTTSGRSAESWVDSTTPSSTSRRPSSSPRR